MAYVYHDYESQSTDAARLARLRLHIGEVNALISADVSADGVSRSAQTLTTYVAQLNKRLLELQASPGAMTNGGFSNVRLTSAT